MSGYNMPDGCESFPGEYREKEHAHCSECGKSSGDFPNWHGDEEKPLCSRECLALYYANLTEKIRILAVKLEDDVKIETMEQILELLHKINL